MPTFIVETREVYAQMYEVNAGDAEAAKAAVQDGKGFLLERQLEYSHTLDPDTWTVEQIPDPIPEVPYSHVLEAVQGVIAPRASELLRSIKDRCEEAGLSADQPRDFSDDYYRWGLYVLPTPGGFPSPDELRSNPRRDMIDVMIEVEEERSSEGGNGFGVNFSLKVTADGGHELGQRVLYNFTPQVWVDARDPNKVYERWDEFAAIDPASVAELIVTER